MLNNDTINRLIQIFENDAMVMDTIRNTIMEFEEYHYAIYKMEHFIRFREKDMDAEEYRDKMTELDSNRTRKHKIEYEEFKKKWCNYIDFIDSYYSTKLHVPRNGTNV